MRKRIKKAIKKVIKKVIDFSKNNKKSEVETIIQLKKELSGYPDLDEYLISRRRIVKAWLSTHSKNGKVLAEKRKIKICYDNKHLCPLGRKKEGCEHHRKFFGYNFCFYFSIN